MIEQARGGWIRDIPAVLGVVLSLVFVGYEIRQNTQVAKAAAIQATAEQSMQISLTWSGDDLAIDLLTRILTGSLPPEFTEHENTKLRLMFLSALRAAESRYRQLQLGVLDDAGIMGGAASIYRTAYLAARWEVLRPAIPPDFAEQFEIEYGLH